MVAGPDKTGKKPKDLTGVIGYVDNLAITAFARPERGEARPMRDEAMVRIPGGTFEMGMHNDPSRAQVELHSVAPDPDELPVHPVSLNSFYMGVYQVTNRQYADALNWALREGLAKVSEGVAVSASGRERYCATTTSSPLSSIIWEGNKFKVVGEELPSDDLHNRTLHPVISVSWFGAAAYCNWRSLQEGLQPAYDPATWEIDFAANGYRLPTEAEREYAARGGLHKPYVMFPWGNSIEGGHANYNRSGDPWESLISETTPVGYYDGNQKPPGPDMRNGYGLYDMAGNSFEWCHDWYDATYYSKSPKDNPRGPATGVERSLRNGSWNCHCLANLRNANRLSAKPGNTSFAFRVVRNDRP
jgi:formylglycine-generating enzyme required for sulfatase activity